MECSNTFVRLVYIYLQGICKIRVIVITLIFLG